ncbi:MAG: hypothetical protein RLZZ385_2441 [Pseudomonadota bacterium]|jgi:lipoprotein-releasing system permease protein
MFKPVALFIGLRYTRTRKRSLLLSFISIISMLGITLGVLAMILVLSVINGSTSVMRAETLKSVPHVTVSTPGGLRDWQALATLAEAHPAVIAAAPFIEGEAWLQHQGTDHFIRLRGIYPQREQRVVQSSGGQFDSLLQAMAEQDNAMIMGLRLAGNLGIYGTQTVGVTPLRSLLARALSDRRSFNVVGAADFGFYGNGDIALVSLPQAGELFDTGGGYGVQLRLAVTDVFAAKAIAESALSNYQEQPLTIVPWMENQRALFDALRMEKYLTGFMLLMIVIIGAVNIISTLVMVVADKGADIAILRTMGASRGTIMGVFIVQGCLAGLLGTLLGAALGVGLATQLDTLSRAFENFINNVLAPERLYAISYLQAELQMNDVLVICLAALAISFLATLYPAYRAARVQPAEVLRYE